MADDDELNHDDLVCLFGILDARAMPKVTAEKADWSKKLMRLGFVTDASGQLDLTPKGREFCGTHSRPAPLD